VADVWNGRGGGALGIGAVVASLTEIVLEEKIFPSDTSSPLSSRPPLDFSRINDELRPHKNVNLTLDLE